MNEDAQTHVVDMTTIDAVRKRPGMYVGSTEFFGFINYLVCPVALLLGQRPARVAVAVVDGGFVVESDVAVPIVDTSDGRLVPFEKINQEGPGHGFEGTVLNALSETLTVEVHHEQRMETLAFRRGVRESRQATIDRSDALKTTLRFAPDTSIFTVTTLSPAVFRSYLRRLSYLFSGVRFSLTAGTETQEFYAERGIVDLFDAVTAPYQLVHDPIHIVAEEGSLRLEAVFAYHSWEENQIWCFINNGRAVEGGTHEKGLNDALKRLNKKLQSATVRRNGIIGIVSIRYPNAVWEGCIKGRVGNPELRKMVSNLVVQSTMQWLQSHPDLAERLGQLEVFRFPEVWFQ